MPVLKTIKSRNLKLTANKGDKTTSKSYSQIGVDASDDAIMNTANAILTAASCCRFFRSLNLRCKPLCGRLATF